MLLGRSKLHKDRPRYRLREGDVFTVDGKRFDVAISLDDKVFLRPEGRQDYQVLSQAEMLRLAAREDFQVVSTLRKALPMAALPPAGCPVSTLKDTAQDVVKSKMAWCEAVDHLHHEKKLKLTDADFQRNMSAISKRALEIYLGRALKKGEKPELSEAARRIFTAGLEPGPRTVRDWKCKIRKLGFSALSGADHVIPGRAQLHPISRNIIDEIVPGYQDSSCPSQREIYRRVVERHMKDSALLVAAGEAPLEVPSLETIRRAILQLDPFETVLKREGEDAARRKFSVVTGAATPERPLERCEMDSMFLDCKLFLESPAIRELLSPELEQELAYKKAVGRVRQSGEFG